jgi:hypothetical protein
MELFFHHYLFKKYTLIQQMLNPRSTGEILLLGLMTLIFWSCDPFDSPSDPGQSSGADDDWLIQRAHVVDGGPGWDGIPNLVNPEVVPVSQITYLEDKDLVIGIKTEEGLRAYPHKILDWHEIANIKEGAEQFVISYCPLTGSAMAWDRYVDGRLRTYGVSGLLYNSNLILFDDRTESLWSQMLMLSVNGEELGMRPGLIPVIETTWSSWKTLYPDSKAVSLNTGYDWPYHRFPYLEPITGADYREDPFLMFPVQNKDDRLHSKERVLGVIHNRKSRAYRFSSFDDGISVLHDEIENDKIVVVGSEDHSFMTVFSSTLNDNTELEFQPLSGDSFPAVMIDNEGNTWDLFGNALSGKRVGQQLPFINSYISYWFAWAAFYPETEIY